MDVVVDYSELKHKVQERTLGHYHRAQHNCGHHTVSFLRVYLIFICVYVCMPHVYVVSLEARRGHQVPWSYREQQVNQCQAHLRPLEAQRGLLATETSAQP